MVGMLQTVLPLKTIWYEGNLKETFELRKWKRLQVLHQQHQITCKNCVKLIMALLSHYSASIYLFKVNNRNTRKWCEICSKLIIKTPEQLQWRRSGVFIVAFEHISHLFLVFLLLTLNKYMLPGDVWTSFTYYYLLLALRPDVQVMILKLIHNYTYLDEGCLVDTRRRFNVDTISYDVVSTLKWRRVFTGL